MIAGVAVVTSGWTIAAWVFIKLRRRFGFRTWLIVPFSWTAWEGWLSWMGELAFPWSHLSLTQAGFSPILQIMEFTGIHGVSFWLVSINLLLFFLIFERRRVPVKMTGIGIILLLIIPILAQWNAGRYSPQQYETRRIGVVQGSIQAHDKWFKGTEFSWSIYDSLSRKCAEDSVELLVWPETALPTHLMHQSIYADKLSRLSDDLNCWILTGASDYNRIDSLYKPLNSAFLIGPHSGIVSRYAKRFLVPFGERVPFQKLCPQLGKLNFGQAEFLPGIRQTIFELPGKDNPVRFPVMICYESIFPRISRRAVSNGANLLVTISNDGWYGWTSEPSQIAALSRFRCIETRRSMARASNSGISALIDPRGREIKRTELYEPACIEADLPLIGGETFYVRFGVLFLIIITVIYGILLLYCAVIWRRS